VLNGKRLHVSGWHSRARLLLLQAQDQRERPTALPLRPTRGACQYRPEMQDCLEDATLDMVERLNWKTRTINPKHAKAVLQ
jgi:hypothetical protein